MDREVTHALLLSSPGETAKDTFLFRQRVFILCVLLLSALIFALRPMGFVIAVNVLFTLFFLIYSAFKIYLMNLSLGRTREIEVDPSEWSNLSDESWPLYTILIPLYKEPETLPKLLESLEGMDYPKEKLDVLLLLEPDDKSTLERAEKMDIPPYMRVVVVPESAPKTKPKACNMGLHMARGKYLVIYDAEDRPEPDQLKKVVVGFEKVGPQVVCLQARLNFYNKEQNILTRWFTVEYSSWFDLLLPGLSVLDSPIPLGGTSNHFKTKQLKELKGWDPYNVAEDCDLGCRLAKRGYRTRMVASTTWEEACSHPYHWVRQRSRWIKGYAQTYLVHTRHPLSLTKSLGLMRSAAFHLTVGGTVLCFLLSPFYWTMTLVWFVTRSELLGLAFPSLVFLMGAICLFVGNFTFAYACAVAAYNRGYHGLVKYAIFIPPYWVMMSVGAWKGVLQLLFKPHYWEKTQHGLSLDWESQHGEKP